MAPADAFAKALSHHVHQKKIHKPCTTSHPNTRPQSLHALQARPTDRLCDRRSTENQCCSAERMQPPSKACVCPRKSSEKDSRKVVRPPIEIFPKGTCSNRYIGCGSTGPPVSVHEEQLQSASLFASSPSARHAEPQQMPSASDYRSICSGPPHVLCIKEHILDHCVSEERQVLYPSDEYR